MLKTLRNMGDAISMLHPIAYLNGNERPKQIYFDTENGGAIVAFRRNVANRGALFLKAQYERNAEVEISPGNFMKFNGLWDYRYEEYKETNQGLQGKQSENNSQKFIDFHYSEAIETINNIHHRVALRYEVKLSPNDIYKALSDRYKGLRGNKDFQDKKVNFHFTAGLPAGYNQAVADKINGEIVMVTEFMVKGVLKTITSYVDRHSTVPLKKIQPGRVYLIKPVLFNKETGERTVDVVRTYKTGIRMAVQKFDRGLFRPGTGSYEVNPSEHNGISPNVVWDIPFMPSQNISMIKGAPLLTFDMDMFVVLMKTLSGYEEVTFKFIDPYSGIYFCAQGNGETQPDIEGAIGPTIPIVRGRVCLP